MANRIWGHCARRRPDRRSATPSFGKTRRDSGVMGDSLRAWEAGGSWPLRYPGTWGGRGRDRGGRAVRTRHWAGGCPRRAPPVRVACAGDGREAALSCGEPASVAALDRGQGEDAVADAPAAVGDLLGKDHGVGACFLAVDLGVQVGGAVDDEFLLPGGQGTGGHLDVREWHDGGPLGGDFAGWLEARAGGQELGNADAVVELGPDAVVDGGDDFAAVAAGVDVGGEGPLAGGGV